MATFWYFFHCGMANFRMGNYTDEKIDNYNYCISKTMKQNDESYNLHLDYLNTNIASSSVNVITNSCKEIIFKKLKANYGINDEINLEKHEYLRKKNVTNEQYLI